ncbi:20304_t:CDS:2 [Rhizophagus irregularis]|nr:20304_t:CDS:2 [Rhizophagus irregularis]
MSNQMLLSLMVVDVITWVIDVLVSVGVMVVVSVDGRFSTCM